MLIQIPRPHRRVVKSLTTMTEANRWASDVDLRILEILRCLEDVQRVLNNITVTNAPATFITSACTSKLGADSGCFRNVTLSNDSTYGALLTPTNNFTVSKFSLNYPGGTVPLQIDATAVRRASSDFAALTLGKGLVMVDGDTPAKYWRLSISTDGIPFCANTGTTAP